MDAAVIRMVALRQRRNEAIVSTATYRKKLFHVQTSFAAAHENVKVILARVAAMKTDQDAVTTKYEDLCFSMVQRMSFANK